MSHQPPTHSTAPGPPVLAHPTGMATQTTGPSNPFHVDLVIPYSIASIKGDRSQTQAEVREGYEALLRALEGEGGLKVASKPGRAGKGKEEIWVFLGISQDKLDELVEREK
jgi:anoctamin-10